MTYMEYKEVKVPDEIQATLSKMAAEENPKTQATLGAAGFFDWLTGLSKDEGWHPVWQAFNFPYLVVEREVKSEA